MPNIGSIMSIGAGSRKSATNIDEGNMNTWNVALVTGRSSSSALSFKFTSTATTTTTTITDQQLSPPLPIINFPSSSSSLSELSSSKFSELSRFSSLSSSKLSQLSSLSSSKLSELSELSSSKLAELSGLQVELSSSGLSSFELSELPEYSRLTSSELSLELSSSGLSSSELSLSALSSSTTPTSSTTTPTIEYQEEITVNNIVITDKNNNNKNNINTKKKNNNKRKLICDCESGCERTINTETEKSVYNMTTIEDNLLFDFNNPLEDFNFTFNLSSSSLNDTLFYPCNKSMENETFILLSMYPSGYSLPTIVFASIVVTLLMIVIVVGNMLVIIAIATEKALKNIQNWFIASLAVADFFLGLIIMPFSLANEIMGYWIFGYWWCDIYSAMDVLLCTASIMNLCLISLDRFWSITQAIAYLKKRTPARAVLMIALVWLLSALVCIPPLLGWKRPNPEEEYPKCKMILRFLIRDTVK